MNKQITIIGASIIVLSLVAGLIFYIATTSTNKEDTPSTETGTPVAENDTKPSERDSSEVYATIENDIKKTDSTQETTFDMTDLKQVEPGWYLAKIHNTNDSSIGNAWVVLKDTGGSLVVIAGPGTYFPKSLPIPDSVRKAMR